MKALINLRALVAQVVFDVVEQGRSLSAVLPVSQSQVRDKDRALLQELAFGVLRTLPLLEWQVSQLMSRALTGKQRTVHYLILLGVYQLLYTRIPAHAVLSETVNASAALKRPAFKGLVNGVLRQFQRQQQALHQAAQQHNCRYLHPQWLLSRLQQVYPDCWQHIVQANNQRPPMWLRVNLRHISREDWLRLWQETGAIAYPDPGCPAAIRLASPVPVQVLPGFNHGWISVQDINAQRCVELLDPKDDETLVDMCAAPGGKTTHILELAPGARVLALDVDSRRLQRVQENLQRMGMQAELSACDGRYPQSWSKNQQFDRILLDAPCSATGVIRRHPDIKWLRRDTDIAQLVSLQAELLNAAWSCLKPGGTLVYATCSLLPEENQQQISGFLTATPDARLSAPVEQLLPDENQGDGFFYARLSKV